MQSALILEPSQTATSCVIWLHGLGASKHDFADVALLLQKNLVRTRFVLPQAPVKPVTINNGIAMPSWYDIVGFADAKQANLEDIAISSQLVVELIEQQTQQGIDSSNIVLAGFSQGGAVVYHTAFKNFKAELAGVLGLSTYAPTIDNELVLTKQRLQTSVMIMHGTQDDIVPIKLGQDVYQILQNKGAKVAWHQYSMQHQFIPEQFVEIRNWLQNLLQPVYA